MTAYLWNLLVALDQLANVLLAPALNATLRPTAARFGHPDETLSSVLGKNVEATPSMFGDTLVVASYDRNIYAIKLS